eukprot:Awhi_evm1s8278
MDVLVFRNSPITTLQSGTFDNLRMPEISLLTAIEEGTFTNMELYLLELNSCPFANHTLPRIANEFMVEL